MHTSVPSAALRRRISGAAVDNDMDGKHFLRSGFDQVRNVLNIADVWGIRFNDNPSILDWGVGCARIARHLPPSATRNFVGVDVDPINIQWCKENMKFGRYDVIETKGKIDRKDNSVDLIYSHSVLTHLDEEHQDHWLQELTRILKPEGRMILTVHGLHSGAAIAGWAKNRDLWDNFLRLGFINASSPNPDIKDVTPGDYYRDVAHTPLYVRNHWPLCGVDVLDIMFGGFGPAQDVIICGKGKPRG